jgi:hypothetical protein
VVLRATGRPPPPPIRVACSVAAGHVADPTGRRRYAYAGVTLAVTDGRPSQQEERQPIVN